MFLIDFLHFISKIRLHLMIILEGFMTKQRWNRLRLSPLFCTLFLFGCGYMENTWKDLTNSGSGSSSNSSSSSRVTSSEVPAHGQATVNLLEKTLFQGKELDPAYWSNLEAYCKAGPTHLIIADLHLVPGQMTRAGFTARTNMQYYALSRTIAGANWSPKDGDAEGRAMWNIRGEIDAWWFRYIQAVVQIMQKAPQTTAVIIVNDAVDHCGRSLGDGTFRAMTSVSSRVSMGNTVPD